LDSPEWVEWLEQPSTLSFAYPIYDSQMGYIRGFMTVRKERRVRGSYYWVAYRRSGGRLRKIYLGQSGQLTQRQLAVTADRFLTMHTPAGERAKEVMPGPVGGASLEWEAMMRRVKSGQQVMHFG
jgi:LuxR family maltose regulon positive regulatory protein